VSDLVLLILNFMSTFSVLVLIAVSLGLIFGQLGIINLAQGDLVMVGAYVMYATRDLPFGLGLAAAVVFGALLGIALERGVIARLYPRGFMPTLLATWGIGIVLRQLADTLFTSTPRTVAAPVGGSITVLGVQYPTYRFVLAGVVALVLAGFLLLSYRTSIGLRVRASIDNVEMASILGVSAPLMFALVFVTGTVMTVFTGALASPVLGITPSLGVSYLAPAFFAVLLGRPGTIAGPVFGAALVSALSVLLDRFFTATVAQSLLFAVLVCLIAASPGGVKWQLSHRIRPRNRSRRPRSVGTSAAAG
jgi:branched-subunit amino acid ABC-type transport system permease component